MPTLTTPAPSVPLVSQSRLSYLPSPSPQPPNIEGDNSQSPHASLPPIPESSARLKVPPRPLKREDSGDIDNPIVVGTSEDTVYEEEEYKLQQGVNQATNFEDMPSDLRPSLDEEHPPHHSQPLLSNDKRHHSLDASQGAGHARANSSFHDREVLEQEAAKATRTRYTYAAAFLMVSLVSFAIQTETAVYIQHNLKWNKAYCMLYFTHGSWSVLYPLHLIILRLQNRHQPWSTFWRRHWSRLRQTAQMVEHRTLNVPLHLQDKSPIPYFLSTTAYVTCALTVAGGSWYVAVNLTTPSDLTAIYNCSAFFAYAFAVPMLHERLRWNKVIAVGIAILGVLVVAYGDQGTAKHGSKSGGGTGGPQAPADGEASNQALGNLVIGFGSVLYGFYEVLYKKVACPPDGCAPDRVMTLAFTFGSLIGSFTLLVLWIPLPILNLLGWEDFALPRGEAAWMLCISVLANATFSGCFLVLISLTSPVLSSVAALLTIFLVALCDEMLPPPLYSPLTAAAIMGGLLIIFAFLLLSWATYVELQEEAKAHADETTSPATELEDA